MARRQALCFRKTCRGLLWDYAPIGGGLAALRVAPGDWNRGPAVNVGRGCGEIPPG